MGWIVARLENGEPIALLVDSGSTLSLIEEDVANDLGLKGPNQPLQLNWTGGHQRVDEDSRHVMVKLTNMDDPNIQKAMFFRTDKNLKMGPQRLHAQEFGKYPHLAALKLHDFTKIQGIIGIDNISFFEDVKQIKGEDSNQPLGISTESSMEGETSKSGETSKPNEPTIKRRTIRRRKSSGSQHAKNRSTKTIYKSINK